MLPSAPLVITIVSGGAGCTKCSVIHTTETSSSRNGPYVSAASRNETWRVLKRGMKGLRTLWLAGIDCQLSGEGPPVGGPRFAAGDIGGQVRIFVQNARRFQPEQHRHHHQVARVERAIEPVGIAQATRKLFQPDANAL